MSNKSKKRYIEALSSRDETVYYKNTEENITRYQEIGDELTKKKMYFKSSKKIRGKKNKQREKEFEFEIPF